MDKDLLALLRGQYVDLVTRRGGVDGDGVQHPQQSFGHDPDRGLVEEVGVVLDLSVDAEGGSRCGMPGVEVEVQVEPRRSGGQFPAARLQTVERERRGQGVVGEAHLEERIARG